MRSLAILLLLTAAAATHAQQPPQPPQQAPQPETLRLNSNLVLVPTQVQTRKGDMLYELKREQFVVEDNGIPQAIQLDEDTDALGLSLVVVVQCSRSAYAQFDRMRGLTAMVDALTGAAPRLVSVVSYGDDPEVIKRVGDDVFTSSATHIAQNLGEIQPCDDEGGADTLDAVDFANKLFDQDTHPGAARNRRAILLIGETRDHGSKIKPAAVVADLGRTNTVVDAVAFNPGKTEVIDSLIHGRMGPGPIGLLVMAVEALRKNVPHTLAELSGGEYINFTTQNGFDNGIHTLSNHIHNYYLLSFQPTGAKGEPPIPGMHKITVKIPDYPDARIRSRLSYYSGTAPPPEIDVKPE